MELWAVNPFKFQWQKVRDESVGPGLPLMSPQRDSKLWIKNNINTVRSSTLRKRKQNDAGIFLIIPLKSW